MRWFINESPTWAERRRVRHGRWHAHFTLWPTRVELQKYGLQTVGTLPQRSWLEWIERRVRYVADGRFRSEELRFPERFESYPSGMMYWFRRPD